MQPQSNMLQTGIENYSRERDIGDLDLVSELRDILIRAGLQLKLPTAFDSNTFVMEAVGKTTSVQRFLLNRYLGQQLLLSAKPAVDERYCLIPNGDDSVWLDLVEKRIIPFMIDNDLPVHAA